MNSQWSLDSNPYLELIHDEVIKHLEVCQKAPEEIIIRLEEKQMAALISAGVYAGGKRGGPNLRAIRFTIGDHRVIVSTDGWKKKQDPH